MARLPVPGSDNGSWGDVLNDFLSQSLNTDGTLKSIDQSKVANLESDLAVHQAAINSKAPINSPAFTGTPTGITKAHIGLANVDNTSDINKPISTSVQSALDEKLDTTGGNMAGELAMDDNAITQLPTPTASDHATNKDYVDSLVSTTVAAYLAGAGSSTNNAVVRWDSTTGKLVKDSSVSISDTGAVTLPSTAGATGVTIFNTADQTTNTEYLSLGFESNTAYIRALATGSGAPRALVLQSNNTVSLNGNGTSFALSSAGTTLSRTNTGNTALFNVTGTFNGTTARQASIAVGTTINQVSSTAGYDGILINPTLTSTGSQGATLINGQVGGVQRFKVDATGSTSLSSSAANGLTIFNTADETTNSEFMRAYFAGNTAYILTSQTGTGTVRNFQIGTTNRRLVIAETPSASGIYQFSNGTGTPAAVGAVFAGNWNASSGTNAIVSISPTIQQTSTAAYTALLVNPTESTTGSGAKLLADFQVGGSSKLSINNSGAITITDTANSLSSIHTANNLVFIRTGALSYVDQAGIGGGLTFRTSVSTAQDTNILTLQNLLATFADGVQIVAGSTSGLKIGTAVTQKLGFFGVTPVVQNTAITDLGIVLSNFGLRAAGTAYPITTSGNVAMTGSVRGGATARTAAVTLTTSNSEYQWADASTAAFTITLPATTTAGYKFTIKKIDATANAVTVAGTIDGAVNYTLSTQYKYVTVVSTATSGVWYIVANN